MALGATPASVMRLVLKQGLTLAALGLILGLLGAAATSHLLTRMLFQVKAADPATYSAVALLLAVVAFAACWLPAPRYPSRSLDGPARGMAGAHSTVPSIRDRNQSWRSARMGSTRSALLAGAITAAAIATRKTAIAAR